MIDGPRPGTILCVGRVYCDLIFTGMAAMPTLGQETFADSVKLHAGGGGFITAAYLSAFGNNVSLATMLPAEPFGSVVAAEINLLEINDQFCIPSSDRSQPQITVAMVQDGERAFLTKRAGVSLPENINDCFAQPTLTHLHIGELTTLIEHPELVPLARDVGLSISLDCGWDDEAFKHPGLDQLIGSTDVFLPNSAEAEQLRSNGCQFDAAPCTVIKLGPNGAELFSRDFNGKRSTQQVEVLDSTGAGDAFNAGFLDAWLGGADHVTCLDAGNKAGAIAVARIGGASGLSASCLSGAKVVSTPDLQAG
ncbi:MAG: carbohydrate kinase family protein [Hyphomicrobiales bacterium]